MKNKKGWELVKLGDVVNISKGKKHEPIINGTNRYINIENLHDASNSLFTNENGVFVDENDLIIAWDGANAGKVGVGFKGVIGSTLARMRIHTNGISPKFLYWHLESINNIIKSQRTGATIPHVNGAALKDLQIPLPPLPEQQRIATLLDAADALRRKDRTLLQKYEELAQAVFMDMFGDPVKNEKGWEVRTIGSIAKVGSGSTPSRQISSYFEGDIPWVKTTEVNGEIILSTEEMISEDALKNSSCKIYPKNSVIIAMYGQGKTRGQVALLGIEAATNQACGVIQPCDEVIPKFLFFYLKQCYNELRALGRGGNQENLNKAIIEDFQIVVPPINEQIGFCKFLDYLEKIKLSNSVNHSESLFSSLLQEAFG